MRRMVTLIAAVVSTVALGTALAALAAHGDPIQTAATVVHQLDTPWGDGAIRLLDTPWGDGAIRLLDTPWGDGAAAK